MRSAGKYGQRAGLEAIATVPADPTHGGNVPEDVVDFSASINPLGPPQVALKEYHAAAAAISSYPPAYPERLTAALAEWLGVSNKEIIVGNGSTQLIHLFARVSGFRSPYVAIPTFSEFANAFILNNRTPYALELRGQHEFTIPIEDVVHAMNHRADAVFIGRPNSPTGSMIALDAAESIVRECERFHAFCVFDEAFIDFAGRAESAIALMRTIPERRREGLVVIGSLTKIFAMPGLRVGFLVAPTKVIGILRKHLEPWSLNIVAERVALACLSNADQYQQQVREWLVPERTYLREQLAGIKGMRVFPSAANFLMLDVDEESGSTTFGQFMLKKRIAVRDLRAMPGCADGLYRVAVRLRDDNNRLLSAARAYPAENRLS